ncbi:MAG: TlpA family protein disulfide reductase, partial [Sphingobacteriales bacterium]
MIKKLTCIMLIAVFTTQQLSAQKLKTGVWRGTLTTALAQQIPFNFEVTDSAGLTQLAIINGAEHFKVTDISSKSDSVFIRMPLFDSEFKLKRTANGLNGDWIKHGAIKDAVMAFSASPDTKWRFFAIQQKT